MGTVVSIEHARQRRAQQDAVHEEPEHYTEEEELESWKLYVRQTWRPVRDVKRGAVSAVFKVAYRDSDQGADWLQACPMDLITAALPAQWDARNLEAAACLTELFLRYLYGTGLISEADKRFQQEWLKDAKATLTGLLKRA